MQLSNMQTRVSQRLNEGATGPVYYPAAEITAALNEALRYFCLLTLGLETTTTWTPGSRFTHMLTAFSDWICPLRITNASGAKIRPATLRELQALDPGWNGTTGAIARYISLGADFLGVYPFDGETLTVTYAQAPEALVNPTDAPAIPAEYHARLVDYAIYRCRQGEGAQEFAKAVPYYNSFLDGAKQYAAYVRSRNKGAAYDKIPPEDEFFDHSKLAAPAMPAALTPAGTGIVLPEAA